MAYSSSLWVLLVLVLVQLLLVDQWCKGKIRSNSSHSRRFSLCKCLKAWFLIVGTLLFISLQGRSRLCCNRIRLRCCSNSRLWIIVRLRSCKDRGHMLRCKSRISLLCLKINNKYNRSNSSSRKAELQLSCSLAWVFLRAKVNRKTSLVKWHRLFLHQWKLFRLKLRLKL